MAGLLVIAGVVLALLIAPILLVWPSGWARIVPRRWRSSFVERPGVLTAAVTLVVGGWAATAMTPLILAHGDPGMSVRQKATAVGLVWLIFGGLTATAVIRTLRVGIAQWAIASQPTRAPASAWPIVTPERLLATPLLSADHIAGPDHRPEQHRLDRALRNATRWLAAAGTLWYLVGRIGQVSQDNADAPSWWWPVTFVLLVTGIVTWIARRIRWRADGRGDSLTSPGRQFESMLRELGLAMHRPAGTWVGAWAPAAFLPANAITGPALWPWAATGVVHGLPVLVAAQNGRLRNATGLTGVGGRTACVVRLQGAQLPQVVIAGREAIPPRQRPKSIPLESETFNRSLWVYGPDARGVYDVVHPRVMAHAVRELPDAASVIVNGATLAVITDEPVSPTQLRQMLAVALRFAELTPSHLQGTPPAMPNP